MFGDGTAGKKMVDVLEQVDLSIKKKLSYLNEFIHLRSNKGQIDGYTYLREEDIQLKQLMNTYKLQILYCTRENVQKMHKHLSRGIINNIRGIIVRLGII